MLDATRCRPRRRRILDPRVWPADRLASFALLNLGIALGIEVGFDSPA